jgi:hypothetical protein
MSEHESKFSVAHPSPLDRAIDRAVRDMMHLDPPPGLRRRVASRLARTSTRPSGVFPWYAMAAAALVLLALVAGVLRRDAPKAPPAAPRAVVQTAPLDRPYTEPLTARPSTPARPTPSRAAGSRSARIVMPRIKNVFGPRNEGITAATLETTDAPPAQTAGSAVGDAGLPGPAEPITIPLIVIPPLAVEPLHIEPLPIRR